MSVIALLLAFVLGAMGMLGALMWAVWHFVLTDDGTASARRRARLHFVERDDPPTPAHATSTTGADEPEGPESATWFNHLLSLMYREIFLDRTFHTFVTARLEKSLNKDRPSWLTPIKVDHHDFGTVCPTMEAVTSRVGGPEDAHQLDGSFRVNWLGNASIRLSTAVHVLSKSLPINARVSIARIAGTMRYTVSKGDDPLLLLGFTALPVVVVDVDTEFGSSLSISNLPKVGAYVSAKIESMIGEELLRPNGGIITHIPIPHVRYMMPMRVAKFNKKKRSAYKAPEKITRLLSKLRVDQAPAHQPVHSASLPPVPSRPATPLASSSPPHAHKEAPPSAPHHVDDSLSARFGRWTGEKLAWMASDAPAPQLPPVPARSLRPPSEERPTPPSADVPTRVRSEERPRASSAPTHPAEPPPPTTAASASGTAPASRASAGAVNVSAAALVDEL